MSREIYFELVRQGNSVRVALIDPETGIEAVVVVPTNISTEQAKGQALKKLMYLLEKKKND